MKIIITERQYRKLIREQGVTQQPTQSPPQQITQQQISVLKPLFPKLNDAQIRNALVQLIQGINSGKINLQSPQRPQQTPTINYLDTTPPEQGSDPWTLDKFSDFLNQIKAENKPLNQQQINQIGQFNKGIQTQKNNSAIMNGPQQYAMVGDENQ